MNKDKLMNQKTFSIFSWSLFALSLAIVIASWGIGVSWQLESLSPYQWFPLFGLLAWIIMAGHYYTGVFRVLDHSLKKPKFYKNLTEYVVLGSLLLHPGILAIAQFNNGEGLPPQSFIDYVGEGLKLAVLLGSISLLLFLSFEVFNRMRKNRFVKKYWLAVSLSQSFAMTFIWVHGLRLGTNLGDGWFRILWIVLGFALLPCFYFIHKADFTKE